jgi:hypothetical protein
MAYHGEILRKPFEFRFENPGVTFVQGGNLNPFGHALFRLGRNIGYVHVDEPLGYPKAIPASEFSRYLHENGKFILREYDLKIPFRQNALKKLEELWPKKWIWLAIPHNCVNFCEVIAEAGGCDWSSITNLPYLAQFFDNWRQEKAPQCAQGSMQIEGLRTLKWGQTGQYKLRTIGLPEVGGRRWWPSVGDAEGGVRCVQMSADGVSMRAEANGGKAVITVRFRHVRGEDVGRLEVQLTP